MISQLTIFEIRKDITTSGWLYNWTSDRRKKTKTNNRRLGDEKERLEISSNHNRLYHKKTMIFNINIASVTQG